MTLTAAVEQDGIEIRPVEKANWDAFEAYFSSIGRLNSCWCMAWRMTREELKTNTGECRKAFIKQRVWDGIPIGLLAFADGQAIAWCSVAPRESHQRLYGDETKDRVWSLTCFYISRAYRGKGLVHRLIRQAKAYAKQNGAAYLEAYPVDPDSPSYRFMGFVKTFEQEGFEFIKDAGTRRHVMIFRLDGENGKETAEMI
ncbi:MAG: GNAT family N-acetyltransferase [Clostridiales bacterium]|nr:GNAT family N-acetyltransferase [Clostridiales bacterium]